MRERITLFEHHDRPGPGVEDPPVFVRDHRDPLHLIRGRHHRKRLLTPAETTFQDAGRLLDTGDMKPSDPPDGDDRACIKEGRRLPDRILHRNRPPVGPEQGETRPAGGTGDRLGVVAPARRVGVLAPAGITHGERLHRRAFPVVGDGVDDTVPRTAVDAGGGPVALVAPARREDIGDAVIADSNIGRDESGEAPGAALEDDKGVGRIAAHIPDNDGIYPG